MRVQGFLTAFLITSLFAAIGARGGSPGHYDGASGEFWRRFSVVIVRVNSFDADTQVAKLDVLGVLSTRHPVWDTINVKYFNDRGWSNIFSPKPGETYILCVHRDGSSWKLYDSTFTFMESGRGAVKIASRDDGIVQRTVDRIRRADAAAAQMTPTSAPASEQLRTDE